MAELAAVQENSMMSMMRRQTLLLRIRQHAIPHNERLGRVIRNMYGRLQVLEKEVAAIKKA